MPGGVTNNLSTRTATVYEALQCGAPHTFATYQVPVGTFRKVTGVNTPGYFRKRRRGELLPITNYVETEITDLTSDGDFSVQLTYANSCGWYSKYTGSSYFPYGVSWSTTEAELNAKASAVIDNYSYLVTDSLAKVYAEGWDGLTFAAELHDTVRLFTDTYGRFVDFARSNASRARDNGWDKVWLEWRYGWRTLYYDIQDIAKMLSKVSSRTRYRKRSTFEDSSTNTSTANVNHGSLVAHYTVTDSWTISPVGTAVVDINLPRIWINPITTAWELVRFSFIVDWFLNVGDYLEAQTILALAQNYTLGMGVRVELDRNTVLSGITFANGWSGSFTTSAHSSGFSCLRKPVSAPLRPSFRINLDVSKIVDLSALLRQILK